MDARALIWASRLVWGLVLSTATLAVAGIAAMFLDLPAPWPDRLEALCVVALAGVAGFALGVANSAAAAMRVLAGDDDTPVAFMLALICAALTGLVSLVGVHIGWAVLTNAPQALPSWQAVDLAGLGLAFVKPAMSYVIAACAEKTARAKAEAEAAEDAHRHALSLEERAHRHAENLARIAALAAPKTAQPSPPERRPENAEPLPGSRRKGLSIVGKAATGAAMGLALMGSGGQAQAAPNPTQTEPAATAQTESEVTPAMRAHAKALIAQGLNARAAHRDSGVPYSTCKRYKAELAA